MIDLSRCPDPAAALRDLIGAGLRPDRWMAGPGLGAAALIAQADPYCRGLMLRAAAAATVRFLALDQRAFDTTARRWLRGEISDADVVAAMAQMLVRAANRIFSDGD